MRRVYGQGRLLTVSKYVVMSWAYMISAGIMVVLTGVYSTLSL
jgi:inner membrane protein involved in colicin E2 resistance